MHTQRVITTDNGLNILHLSSRRNFWKQTSRCKENEGSNWFETPYIHMYIYYIHRDSDRPSISYDLAASTTLPFSSYLSHTNNGVLSFAKISFSFFLSFFLSIIRNSRLENDTSRLLVKKRKNKKIMIVIIFVLSLKTIIIFHFLSNNLFHQ